jgi:hypothetical protein
MQQKSAVPHKHDVHICAKPDVISQIPAVVVRVFVDHDIVPTPVPVAAISDIVRRNGKIEPAKPEPTRPAAFDPENMIAPEAAAKVPVFPWTIEVVMRIIAPRVMSYPFVSFRLDVWRGGMTWFIAEISPSLLSRRARLLLALKGARRRGWCRMWRGSVRGNVPAADAASFTSSLSFILRKARKRKQRERENDTEKIFHQILLDVDSEPGT